MGNVLLRLGGRPGGKGERAVANFDQDSLTMGVDASLDCLKNASGDSIKVDGLFFSSTSPPYKEKFSSSLVALALDLPFQLRSADYIGSLRSSSSAILGAIDAIKSSACNNVLVVAADCRLAEPGSALESIIGDGAVALLISQENIAADIVASFSISDEFIDLWRREEDLYIRQDDIRFAQQYGYVRLVGESVKGLLNSTGHKPEDFSKVILPVVDARSHVGLAKRLGFDPKKQIQDSVTSATGIIGGAHPLLLLCAALETASPGDRMLFVSYGDGSDAFVIKVTDNVLRISDRARIRKTVEDKRDLNNYNKYLSFRRLIKGQEPFTSPFSSLTLLYRERDHNIRFYGKKCRKCGLVQFLRDIHVCPECHAQDEYESVKLSKEGILFTFNHEHYYPSPDSPTTMANVDLPEGARITIQMIDTPVEKVKVGMPVELTFRNYHDGNFFHNYFWKCRG